MRRGGAEAGRHLDSEGALRVGALRYGELHVRPRLRTRTHASGSDRVRIDRLVFTCSPQALPMLPMVVAMGAEVDSKSSATLRASNGTLRRRGLESCSPLPRRHPQCWTGLHVTHNVSRHTCTREASSGTGPPSGCLCRGPAAAPPPSSEPWKKISSRRCVRHLRGRQPRLLIADLCDPAAATAPQCRRSRAAFAPLPLMPSERLHAAHRMQHPGDTCAESSLDLSDATPRHQGDLKWAPSTAVLVAVAHARRPASCDRHDVCRCQRQERADAATEQLT